MQKHLLFPISSSVLVFVACVELKRAWTCLHQPFCDRKLKLIANASSRHTHTHRHTVFSPQPDDSVSFSPASPFLPCCFVSDLPLPPCKRLFPGKFYKTQSCCFTCSHHCFWLYMFKITNIISARPQATLYFLLLLGLQSS